jgi:hypothetical protein
MWMMPMRRIRRNQSSIAALAGGERNGVNDGTLSAVVVARGADPDPAADLGIRRPELTLPSAALRRAARLVI